MKEQYFRMYLYKRENGNESHIKDWLKVVGESENEDCLKAFPILGKREGKSLIEFFSQEEVSDKPCAGLSYTMLVEITKEQYSKLVRSLTEKEKKRGIIRAKDFKEERIADFGRRK